METGNLVKNIIEKIKLWLKNFFRKKRQLAKKKTNFEEKQNKKKPLYQNIITNINDNKNSNIGTFLYKTNFQRKEALLKKHLEVRKKIAGYDTNFEENIKLIKEIEKLINNHDLYVNQYYEINKLLSNSHQDNNLNLNTNEKLILLKENISTIIDKKLNDYEIKIIEKAYREYQEVNYIIVTTLIIDDLITEIEEVYNDFKKNKYSKIEYERLIKNIKEKIAKIEEINNYVEVEKEIELLRKDFYTKKKDKYDLLYNKEIFINLYTKCNEILKKVKENEKKQNEKKKFIIEKKNEEEKRKYDQKIKQKEKDKLQKEKDNILKRFIDIEIAHRILLLRESKRKKLHTKDELIKETLNFYDEFVMGETQEFKFSRNKIKTEVAKLYNDITSTICTIQKKEFIPLEHINIKLTTLTEKTLEHQTMLNYMIEKKHQYKINEHPSSKNVSIKLIKILEKEKEKEKTDKTAKILKKEYINQKENNHSN